MKLFIAILNEGWIRSELSRELVMLGKTNKNELIIEYSAERPVDHNRSSIVKRFLKTDSDFLIQIDHDTVPNKEYFESINEKYDVLSFPTPIFIQEAEGHALFLNCFKKVENSLYPIPVSEGKGIIEVDATGGGCLVIHRRVLEKIKAPFIRLYDEDGLAILGSDLNFSRLCLENGFKMYADMNHVCKHFKTIDINTFLTNGKQDIRSS